MCKGIWGHLGAILKILLGRSDSRNAFRWVRETGAIN
jgi:hypothetical protein